MRKPLRYGIGLALVVLLALALGIVSYLGCGGSGTSGAGGGRTLTLGGIVMAPTTSNNIAVPTGSKSANKAVSDSASIGTTCTFYTIDGTNLGSAITGADGRFSLSVTFTESSATFNKEIIAVCGDLELFKNIYITETATTADMGTVNADSTVAANAVANNISGFSGWGTSYTSAVSNLDMGCISGSLNSVFANASLTGEGLADDNAILSKTIKACMAGGTTPASIGYSDWSAVMRAVLNGSISTSAWASLADCAAAPLGVSTSTLTGGLSTSQSVFSALNTLFASQFATTGYAVTSTVCSSMKAGTVPDDSFTLPILAATDLTAFNSTYGSSGGAAVHVGFLEQCQTYSNCADMETNPGSYFGFMVPFSGTFTNLWDGSSLTSNIGGAYLAADKCTGSTWSNMALCGKAMYNTVYTGAGGDWSRFQTAGAWSADYFNFWGQYYTGQATSSNFNPDSLNYSTLWSQYYGSMTDTASLTEIETCAAAIYAAGGYDTSSCYETPATSVTAGTYKYSSGMNVHGCSFSNTYGDQVYVYTYPSNVMYIYYGADYSQYVYCEFSFNSSTGVMTYSNGSDEFVGEIKVGLDGSINFFFASGYMSSLGGTCTAGTNGGKVYTKQ